MEFEYVSIEEFADNLPVLPSQFFRDPKAPVADDTEFMAGMLKAAVEDYKHALCQRDDNEVAALEAWFGGEDAPLKFDVVCEKLNLEPSYVRRLLRDVRAEHLQKVAA